MDSMGVPKSLKYSTILFFLYLFAEGVLRKWIIPSVPGIVLYGIKYAFLVYIAIVYFRNRHYLNNGDVAEMNSIHNAFKIYVAVLCISAISFTMFYNGPIVASITLLQYSAPIILIYAIPALIRSELALKKVITVFLFITAVVMILGVIQYFSPPLSPINRYAEEIKNGIALVGGAARICSVFSYITPLGDFCIICGTFIFSIILTKPEVKYAQLILTSLLILVMVVSVMTGSRSVVIILFTSTVFLILKQVVATGNIKMLFGIAVVSIFVIWFYDNYGISAVDNFIDRVNASHDSETRINRMFNYNRMIDSCGLFGFGIGIANLSVTSFLATVSPIDFEEEIGRVVVEFGLLGFILITFIRVYIWIKMLRITNSIKTNNIRILSLASLIVITPMTFYIQLCLYNWFAYMMYFTMIGLNIALINIDHNEE